MSMKWMGCPNHKNKQKPISYTNNIHSNSRSKRQISGSGCGSILMTCSRCSPC